MRSTFILAAVGTAAALRVAPLTPALRVVAPLTPHVAPPRIAPRVAAATMQEAADEAPLPPSGLRGRLRSYFSVKMDKKSLAALGGAMLLSYGFVSNASYMLCLSIAWYAFSSRTGLSPLSPGQWKPFLAVYGGLVLLQNVIRPLRFALSAAISPAFDELIALVGRRTGLNKVKSMGVVVVCVNVVGTFTLMFSGIAIASLLSGVPVWAK